MQCGCDGSLFLLFLLCLLAGLFSFGFWLLSGVVVGAAGNMFLFDGSPQNVLMMPQYWVNGSNLEDKKKSKKEKKEKKERKEREEEERRLLRFIHQFWIVLVHTLFVSHKF